MWNPAQPICMPFFNGVSTDASAYPLNATDIANQINLLFANPNGMVSLAPCFRVSNSLALCSQWLLWYCLLMQIFLVHPAVANHMH